MATTVGIIGGGQLGRMLYQASLDLDVPVSFFVRETDEGVRDIAPNVRIGQLAYNDLSRFCETVDVLTFEHELTPITVLEQLERDGFILRPSASVMQRASDKMLQRELFAQLDVDHIPYEVLDPKLINSYNLPLVAKATTGGYDGRGVILVTDRSTLNDLSTTGSTWLIEPVLAIEKELAVIAVRSTCGEIKTYPAVCTVQQQGICVEVYWPCDRDYEALSSQAESVAFAIAEELDLVGVLAVEFFIVGGQLLVNELAPRVHNSGHLTIEAALVSQFENHLRAVAGMPLGPTDFQLPVSMLNLIGAVPAILPQIPGRIHLYGKTPRPGRKVGHITATGTTVDEARARARKCLKLIERN
jgi:5-(carboxyamino)imidazole ribonucleotide synthase